MRKFNKKKFILFKFSKKFKKKNPFFLFKIKSDLIKTLVSSNYLENNKLPKKILSQIIYKDLINEQFNEKIFQCLLYKKKLIYPLPNEWIKIVNKKVQVNNIFCKLGFFLYVFKSFFKKFILNFVIILKYKPDIKNKNINVFFDLSDGIDYHLNSKSDNFFKKFSNITKKNIIIHDNKNIIFLIKKNKLNIIFFKDFHFINNNIFKKIKLMLFLFFNFFTSFISLIFGRIERPILFDDIVKLMYLKENKFESINFLFNNSTLIHRPLWAYENFYKNISSYVYYYSSNVLALLISKNEEEIHSQKYTHFYNLLTWNKYLTTSNEQNQLLRQYLDNYEYKLEKIGVVPFEGKKFQILKKKNFKYLSLFDVTPFKLRRIAFHENPFWYYNYKNTLLFYENIINYFSRSDKWIILIKRKRLGDKKIKINLKYPNMKLISPSVSAIEVIKKSDLVVSMPYSTPPFYAREKKIPSFFFDPTGILKKKHINNQNIPLLSNDTQIDEFLIKNEIKL